MLGALETAVRSGVAVAFGLRAHAVPRRAVAACEVALRAGGAVAALAVERGRVVPALAACGLPAGCRRDACLALAVIERADHHRLVDIVFLEFDQHLLPDARQPLPAHAGTGLPLRDRHPAAAAVIRAFALLPWVAHSDLAPRTHMVLRVAAGLGLPIRADHDGTVYPVGSGFGIQATGVGMRHNRSPGAARVASAEFAGVAVGAGGGKQVSGRAEAFDGLVQPHEAELARTGFRRAGRRVEGQRGFEPAQLLTEHRLGVGGQVVDAAVLHQVHQQWIRAVHVLRQVRAIAHLQARAAAQCAHRAASREQSDARFDALHHLLGDALGVGRVGCQRWADRQIGIGTACDAAEAGRRMTADGAFGLRIPGRHRHPAD
ncbi:hypothetical protein GO286_04630 [Ralstonia solanacearum]|nr:hypothetical protein [Ralstonia solanacearum]